MVAAILYQLTRNLSEEDVKAAGFETYFVDHTAGVYPQFASGTPWTAATMQVKGDPIADLTEDLAAEQKARTTYDNLIRLVDDPDVLEPLKFLREREIVHYQRFGECLERLLVAIFDSRGIPCIGSDEVRPVRFKIGQTTSTRLTSSASRQAVPILHIGIRISSIYHTFVNNCITSFIDNTNATHRRASQHVIDGI